MKLTYEEWDRVFADRQSRTTHLTDAEKVRVLSSRVQRLVTENGRLQRNLDAAKAEIIRLTPK